MFGGPARVGGVGVSWNPPRGRRVRVDLRAAASWDAPAQQPGKRKTPRRALRTRRCARPTGRLGRDDPPLSDHPALAFVSFSFTARQSRSSGGRFPFVGHPPRLPGAAEPTWLARPRTVTRPAPPQPADVVAPVAWCSVADRRCVPPPRSPGLSVCRDCRRVVPGRPGRTRRLADLPCAPPPLPPREPGWSPSLAVAAPTVAHRRCPHGFEAVPRAPVGVRSPVRCTLCTLHFPRSRGIFEVTGLSTTFPGDPQEFLGCPPSVHMVVHM
jgi:hypothetical protein